MNVGSALLKSESFEEFSGATGLQFARPRPVSANYMQHVVPNSETTGGITPSAKTSLTVGDVTTADYSNINNGVNWWYGCSHSSVDKAYQVLRSLMKAKVIKVTTLTQFFAAMDEVVKVV